MPSPSPKRSNSKGRVQDADEAILSARIESHKIEYPKQVLLGVGLATAFLPAYLAHAFFALNWAAVVNIPLFAIVMGATAVLLSQAYSVMFETEFLKRQRHYIETKTDKDEKILRQLRLQVALFYAIFFVNVLFFIFNTLVQGYVLRKYDARVGLVVSPIAVSFILGFIAKKNEEARKRRVGRTEF